jgi:hypothetical protein
MCGLCIYMIIGGGEVWSRTGVPIVVPLSLLPCPALCFLCFSPSDIWLHGLCQACRRASGSLSICPATAPFPECLDPSRWSHPQVRSPRLCSKMTRATLPRRSRSMPACASRLRARSFASTWPGRAEIRRACYAIPTRLRLLTAEQFMLSARTKHANAVL